jgi:hypothetical protein
MMERIDGIKIPDFKKFEKIRDLIWFDGPLVSHFISPEDTDYVFYWSDLDKDKGIDKWIITPVNEHTIERYIERQVTLKDLMLGTLNGIAFSADVDKNHNYCEVYAFSIDTIDPSYLPEDDTYNDFEIIDYRTVSNLSRKNEIGILEMKITGATVKRGAMELSQFIKALGKVEDILNKIAPDYVENTLRRDRRIEDISQNARHALYEQSHFEILTPVASSFKIFLKPLSQTIGIDNGREFTDMFTDEFLNLFQNSMDNNIPGLEHYDASYRTDILGDCIALAKLIKSDRLNLDFSWYNSNTGYKRRNLIKNEDSDKIIQNIISYKTRESKKFKVSGYFTSLNVNSGYFTFYLDKDTPPFKGYYSKGDKTPLKQIKFDKNYSASLESIYDKEGDEKITMSDFSEI